MGKIPFRLCRAHYITLQKHSQYKHKIHPKSWTARTVLLLHIWSACENNEHNEESGLRELWNGGAALHHKRSHVRIRQKPLMHRHHRLIDFYLIIPIVAFMSLVLVSSIWWSGQFSRPFMHVNMNLSATFRSQQDIKRCVYMTTHINIAVTSVIMIKYRNASSCCKYLLQAQPIAFPLDSLNWLANTHARVHNTYHRYIVKSNIFTHKHELLINISAPLVSSVLRWSAPV